jgi:hypothetical protein
VVCGALEAGVIGLDAAQQIARVATEQTEALWVERAQQRTAKHLREEVELAEVVARTAGERGCLPPGEAQMRAYFGMETEARLRSLGLPLRRPVESARQTR